MGSADDYIAWAERVHGKLWRYVYRLRNDDALADDAVQHALSDAWARWESPDWDQIDYAWFCRHVYRVARNHVYKDRRDWRRWQEALPDDVPDRPGGIPQARREAVWAFVQQLPQDLRE